MKEKRERYFIDPSFQTGFILKFCLVVVVSSLVMGAVVLGLTRNSTTVAIENTKVMVKPTSDFIFPVLSLTVVVVAVFSAGTVLFLTLYHSHKIVGPMSRLRREIELFKQGDLDRNFSIRHSDQFQALSECLGQVAETFREKHLELKHQLKELKKFLNQGKGTVPEKAQMESLLSEITRTLDYFNIR